MKTLIIFVLLTIHFVFSENHINATGFNESYSLRSGLSTVNEGGIIFNIMENEKICGIYKITSPTNKIYIGKSIDIKRRRNEHLKNTNKEQTKIFYSLKKHGWEKHKFEIICQGLESELNNLEKYYITLFQTFNSKYGLNLREGGEGGRIAKEVRKRMSETRKGKKMSEKTKQRMSKAKSKPIIQYDKNGNYINEFYGIRDASRRLNLSSGHITEVINKSNKYRHTTGGYIFKYKIL